MHRSFAVLMMSLVSVCTTSAMEYGFKTGLVNSNFDYDGWDEYGDTRKPYFRERLTSLSIGLYAEHEVSEWMRLHSELLYLQKGGAMTRDHYRGYFEHDFEFRGEVRFECLRAGFSVRPGLDIGSLRVFSVFGAYADFKITASGVYPGEFFESAYTGLGLGAGVEFGNLKSRPSIEIIFEKEHQESFPEDFGPYRFRQMHARLLFGF